MFVHDSYPAIVRRLDGRFGPSDGDRPLRTLPVPIRFVILHHRVAGGEHWDLMLERDGVLVTWQLLREPAGSSSLPIPARRIGDHRIAYLEYEGPVSRDRGTVRRADSGAVTIEELTDSRCVFEAAGTRLAGRYVLARGVGEEWSLAPA